MNEGARRGGVRIPRRIQSPVGGFTLLEITIVLVIAAMLAGGAIGVMLYSSAERQLRRAGVEIEILAKRARTTAMVHQTPYALVFVPGQVSMMPLAEAGVSVVQQLSQSSTDLEGDAVAAGHVAPVRCSYFLDGNMTLFLRRWGGGGLLPMSTHASQVWRFDPNGLCEPVTVRLQLGNNWLEESFHPLTAGVRETAMEAR